jgi:hypothetical protein
MHGETIKYVLSSLHRKLSTMLSCTHATDCEIKE